MQVVNESPLASKEIPLPRQVINKRGARSQRTVIGSAMLNEYRADLDDTVLPDWVSSGPRQMGSKGHGKLKADEWRSAATIHWIITLGRLWGVKPKGDRFREMWENYVHIVLVALWSARRSTSAARQKLVADNMKEYLVGVRQLFPQVAMSYNQHLTLHLPELLDLFGPAHSWWAFPFERYNGMLQAIPHNFKFGEYEALVPSECINPHASTQECWSTP